LRDVDEFLELPVTEPVFAVNAGKFNGHAPRVVI
jgi:hypothetical protein